MFADLWGSGGRVHGTGSCVECVLDLATQEGQDADDDESDERDEQAILDEGLALFFLQKLFDHGDSGPQNCALVWAVKERGWAPWPRLFSSACLDLAALYVEPFWPYQKF